MPIQNPRKGHSRHRKMFGGIWDREPGRIGGELAHGTPECEELRRCDEVLLAVVNSQWQASLAQHRCWRKSDLREPYPKGARDLKQSGTWMVIFSVAGI